LTDEKIYAGETLGRTLTFTDVNGNAFDPTTISGTIRDSAGTAIATFDQSDTAHLVKVATGKYDVLYNIPSPCLTGVWKLEGNMKRY
jgi:hypothetical protein